MDHLVPVPKIHNLIMFDSLYFFMDRTINLVKTCTAHIDEYLEWVCLIDVTKK